MMSSLSLGNGFCNCKIIYHHQSPFLPPTSYQHKLSSFSESSNSKYGSSSSRRQKLPHLVPAVRCISGGGEAKNNTERRTFLTLEEAGLVEMTGLSTHERFLCRLTISSLNLLKVIAEQEECSIEELNAGKVCDWFIKDKLKSEQNLDSTVLQWDDSEFPV